MLKHISGREARKETRAIILLLVIVVIGVVLLGYQYFAG
jgi:hypothetical protein